MLVRTATSWTPRFVTAFQVEPFAAASTFFPGFRDLLINQGQTFIVAFQPACGQQRRCCIGLSRCLLCYKEAKRPFTSLRGLAVAAGKHSSLHLPAPGFAMPALHRVTLHVKQFIVAATQLVCCQAVVLQTSSYNLCSTVTIGPTK